MSNDMLYVSSKGSRVFTLSNDYSLTTGTSFIDNAGPIDDAKVMEVFGHGSAPSSDDKVQMYELVFTDDNNNVYTLYDYKGDSGHIGGFKNKLSDNDINNFKRFLKESKVMLF